MAYRLVHCLAILSCSALFVMYWVAMLPTRGSARGSHREDRTDQVDSFSIFGKMCKDKFDKDIHSLCTLLGIF